MLFRFKIRIQTPIKILGNTSNIIEVNEKYNFLFKILIILHNKFSDVQSKYKVNLILRKQWQLGSVHCCSVGDNHISYSIKLPIQSPLNETFFLLSYPVFKDNQFIITLQHPPFILRSNEILRGNCISISNSYNYKICNRN